LFQLIRKKHCRASAPGKKAYFWASRFIITYEIDISCLLALLLVPEPSAFNNQPMSIFPNPALFIAFTLACMPADGQVPRPRTFTVDDFPLTDRMLTAHYCDTCTLKSGGLCSIEKVWFTNKTLRQTLVYQLYTDDFHQDIFLFSNDDIPAAIMDHMELYDSTDNYASHQLRAKYFRGLLRFATLIARKYFVSDKGFALGDSLSKAINIYGKPDRRTVAHGVEVLEWEFEGENVYDGKKDLKGKPLAADNFGLKITMCFRNERLIGIAFQNAVP
jgi:hypothetical protein